jgi:DNA-binding NarL/FixJ family response regulator
MTTQRLTHMQRLEAESIQIFRLRAPGPGNRPRLVGVDGVAAIHAVAAGDAIVSPRLTRRLLDAHAYDALAPATQPRADARLAALTEREHEVLAAIARGWTNAEIAEHFTLTESTVKKHVSRVFAKIGARDRIQAVIFAYDAGLAAPQR